MDTSASIGIGSGSYCSGSCCSGSSLCSLAPLLFLARRSQIPGDWQASWGCHAHCVLTFSRRGRVGGAAVLNARDAAEHTARPGAPAPPAAAAAHCAAVPAPAAALSAAGNAAGDPAAAAALRLAQQRPPHARAPAALGGLKQRAKHANGAQQAKDA